MLLFIIFSVMIGAAMGSFACCQAWRIRYGVEGKKLGKRSVCLSCGKKLRWYENIPIISWVIQGGRCRRCGKEIGKAEIISEVLGGIFGGLLGIKFLDGFIKTVFKGWELWGAGGLVGTEIWGWLGEVLLIVVIFTTMGLIAIYDAKWGEMPTKLLWGAVIFSVIYSGLKIYSGEFKAIEVLGSIGILAGVYYILYKVSEERWVGGGDWILCLAIAMMLGKPFLALLELTLANTLGLVVIGLKRIGKNRKKQKKEIPFGPFLVIACMIIFIFG